VAPTEGAPNMPKYLIAVNYTAEGAKGVAREGGTARLQAARDLLESLGGTLEAMYFAFGDADVYAIADMPSAADGAAAAMALAASGAASSRTIVLITPEEVDEAAKKVANYRPPGT
jgi:uncharacterized protein with GYD domain